jgi:ornithine cyclodeaminase/alanine dehydrogenase-like protein (mu-crystallin family)
MLTTTVLAASDIARIVSHYGLDALMDDLIDRLETACRQYSKEEFTIPARAGFHYEQPVTGLIEWMPAMQHGKRATVKMVGYHPQNPRDLHLPTILSSVLLFDTRDGHLAGVIDGNFLTALRTGAASAVASRCLAAPGARTLGLIGCGAQSVTQFHALSRVFSFDRILIHDANVDAQASFALRVRNLNAAGTHIEAASPATIVATSDIICTCTSVAVGGGPVFTDADTKAHLHINAVGSDFPGKTELPATLLRRASVHPDFREQAVAEGECQQLTDDAIGTDLAQLVRDTGLHADYQQTLTVFDSTGWALEDHVAGEMLLDYASEIDAGSQIELESLCADPLDPYGFAAGALDIVSARRRLAE